MRKGRREVGAGQLQRVRVRNKGKVTVSFPALALHAQRESSACFHDGLLTADTHILPVTLKKFDPAILSSILRASGVWKGVDNGLLSIGSNAEPHRNFV